MIKGAMMNRERVQDSVVREILTEYNKIIERMLSNGKTGMENSYLSMLNKKLLRCNEVSQLEECGLAGEELIIVLSVEESKKYLPDKTWEKIRFGKEVKGVDYKSERALDKYYLYFSLALMRTLDEKSREGLINYNNYNGH